MRYYLLIDSQASGPHDIAQIATLFDYGAINKDTMSSSETTPDDWRPIHENFPSIAAMSKMTNEVCITDIDMSFSSMIVFMVKWAFASIPAFIIIAIIVFAISAILSAVVGGLFR